MTFAEYIDQLSPERKEIILEIDSSIRAIISGVEVNMQYKMPTYSRDGHVLAALASQKQHMALYIMPYDLLENYDAELGRFDCGESCIRFSELSEEDLDLFSEIIEYVDDHYSESAFYGKILTK